MLVEEVFADPDVLLAMLELPDGVAEGCAVLSSGSLSSPLPRCRGSGLVVFLSFEEKLTEGTKGIP